MNFILTDFLEKRDDGSHWMKEENAICGKAYSIPTACIQATRPFWRGKVSPPSLSHTSFPWTHGSLSGSATHKHTPMGKERNFGHTGSAEGCRTAAAHASLVQGGVRSLRLKGGGRPKARVAVKVIGHRGVHTGAEKRTDETQKMNMP